MDQTVESPKTGPALGPPSEYSRPTRGNVGALVRSGIKWTLSGLVIRQVIGVFSTAILARLLTPSDYGVVAMATVYVSFLSLLDTGITWATVQADKLDEEAVNTAFWFGGLLGLAMWVICAMGSPLVAMFFNDEKLILICVVLGGGLFLNSLTSQLLGMAKRRIRQSLVAAIDTVTVLVANAGAIVCALQGLGYWALVIQFVGGTFVRLSLYSIFSRFRPGKPMISTVGARMFRRGVVYGLTNWINYFQLYVDSILVGRFLGPVNMGIYNRAFYLRTLPTSYLSVPAADVVIPALSALSGDRNEMGMFYRRSLNSIAYVSFFVGIVFFVAPREIVYILFGRQWVELVGIVRILSLPAALLPALGTTAWLFIATGQAQAQLRLGVVLSSMAIAGFVIAVPFGLNAVALACTILFSLPFPVLSVLYSHKSASVSAQRTIGLLIRILLCAGLSVLLPMLLGTVIQYETLPLAVSLAVKVFAASVGYLLFGVLLLKPFPDLPIMKRLVGNG